MKKEFLDALTESIKDRLIVKEEVTIKGLGRFRTRHQKQVQQEDESGRIMLYPPRDVIEFTPEN